MLVFLCPGTICDSVAGCNYNFSLNDTVCSPGSSTLNHASEQAILPTFHT